MDQSTKAKVVFWAALLGSILAVIVEYLKQA